VANSPRRFEIGEVFAIHTVAREIEKPKYAGRDRWYLCECGGCGVHNEMSTSALISAKQRNSNRCASCPPGIAPKKKHDCGDHCPTCYDLPHRRPQSKPCKCGERYADDAFCATVEDADACANLWTYAASVMGDGYVLEVMGDTWSMPTHEASSHAPSARRIGQIRAGAHR
jgi:hypothetical protein